MDGRTIARWRGLGRATSGAAVAVLALSQAGGSRDTVQAETVPPCRLHTITVPLAGQTAHRQPALLGLTARAALADLSGAGAVGPARVASG